MKLKVRNWRKFQHYKDRNPPWIKLHFEMLSSRDWVVLDNASRVLAVACMLIASRNDGEIDTCHEGIDYIKRVAYLNCDPDFKPLIKCGFLESASGCKQMLADARPEIETETEKETEKPLVAQKPRDAYSDEFENLWKSRPKRKGTDNKREAFKAYQARIREGHSHDELLNGVKAYREFVKAEGKEGTEFVKMTATLLGPNKHFADDWKPEAPKSENKFRGYV